MTAFPNNPYLIQSFTKRVEFPKDVHFGEFKRLFAGVLSDAFLCTLEALLILMIQSQASFELSDQRLSGLIPHTMDAAIC